MNHPAVGLTMMVVLTVSACAAVTVPEAEPHQPAQVGAAPARDGDAAVREEFESAERAGTIAAYQLFIARHPRHELAQRARDRIDRIQTGSR
jgi:hypothetical protein